MASNDFYFYIVMMPILLGFNKFLCPLLFNLLSFNINYPMK